MPMNINQQVMALNIHKTTDSDIFWLASSSIFELKIRVFDEVYAYLIIQSSAVFPA